MAYFLSEGVNIHFEIEGKGPDLIMVHGFAGSGQGNYHMPGIVNALKDQNRVITMDCRGHGLSGKPHEASEYGPKMIQDIINLMVHLGISRSNFMGYSMGSNLCLNLLLQHPELVQSAVLGGFGLTPPGIVATTGTRGLTQRGLIVEALLAEDASTITDARALGFRRFAESTHGDLKALAACMEGNARQAETTDFDQTVEKIKKINVPVMTVCGHDDNLIVDSTYLPMLVPGAVHVLIQGKDHLTVVADPRLRMAIHGFFEYVNRM